MPGHSNKMWIPFEPAGNGLAIAGGTRTAHNVASLAEATLGADLGNFTVVRSVLTAGVDLSGATADGDLGIMQVGAHVKAETATNSPQTAEMIDWLFVWTLVVSANSGHTTGQVDLDNRSARMVRGVGEELEVVIENRSSKQMKYVMAGRFLIVRK